MFGRSIRGMFIFLLMMGFCFQADGTEAAEKLNYRLKWLFNTSVVGDLYADFYGIFKANGLDVTLKEGGPERDAIRELELGHAQFGVASADQVIRARSKGAPVVVLAQIFQANPLQWIYRTSQPPILSPEDLKGRVIGITYGGNDETIMRTLLAKGGIEEREVRLFSVRYDFTPFYQKKVDIWPVYRNSQGPILAEKLGKEREDVAFFDPSRFGVRFVANSVVTSERMVREHPETVRNFISALLQGWREALKTENRDKSLKMLGQFDRDTAPDIRSKQLSITRNLIQPSHEVKIGTIDVEAWKQTEKIMLEQKLIPEPVFVEKVLMPQE
ncbi:nitrate ABC transporter substrate-binding protei n [Desulfonema ishimotonii]|uniref:Thiamine pyrimidine synthase n=1 Tax=Desulfonema ishimotonii TaxID=45657 RepID=A0A401FWC2_9BACT|nr:ABC transporter substrate-binding protein [Desulfonema ishimotonii]GBC61275.1 nitrate ABC transporter substrate-binding protei n [Desulfonema ishimotonii]